MRRNNGGASSDWGSAPHILEIRVHGVSNTPPHRMLGLDADEVVRAAGDDDGSFWVPEPEVLAQLRASPDVAADDFRLPPPGVRREAYSWGALARLSTVPFLSSTSGLLSGLVRTFWVLIIPFGLVNAAYWARRLDTGAPPDPGGTAASGPPCDRSLSGGLVRLFGWALTMLWTSTALTVTVGTVAARCYVHSAGADVVYVCAALPAQMEALARWSPGARTAALAAVALVAVVGVGLVGLTGAVRFDRRVSASHGLDLAAHGGVPPGGAPSWPFLSRTGLWSHAVNGWAGWAYHVASGMALVGLAVTVQLLTWGDTSAWPVVVPTIGFGLVVVLAAVRISTLRVEARDAGTAWSRGLAWVVLALAAALLVGVLVPLRDNRTMNARTEPWTLALTTWAVPALIGLLAVLVVGALALRTVLSAWWPALVAGVVACTALALATGAAWPWWIGLALLAGYAVAALRAPAPRRADGSLPGRRWRAFEGWGGAGPAVFLSLAAGFALVLSGAVATGTVAWLEAAAAPERTPDCSSAVAEQCAADVDPLRDPVWITPPVADPGAADAGGAGAGTGSPADWSLPLPRGYDGFSFTSLAAVLALLVPVLAVAGRHLVLRRRPLPVGPPGEAIDDPWHGWTQGTRRLAAIAHRAEPLVAILATALWLATVAGLAIVPFDATADRTAGSVSQLNQLGLTLPVGWHTATRAVVVAALGLLVASVVLGGSGKARSRPWGLLWDLTCFLPRVAHPFAAPSYAERAVPELRGRIDDWLGVTEQGAMPGGADDATEARARDAARPAPDDRGDRRVIVAAHSLGAVVSVAMLLARQLADGTVQDPERIALLTFGTQLRAYFGRFFPELFGPEVLGTDPCRRARLWSTDPWAGEREPHPATESRPRSVVGFLSAPTLEPWPDGPRWRSLWRRTDYLGFPVDAYLPGRDAGARDIDHRSSEVDPTTYLFTVATHGGDFHTPQYRRELLELVRRLDPPGGGTPLRRGPAPGVDQPPPAEFTR